MPCALLIPVILFMLLVAFAAPAGIWANYISRAP